MINTKFLVYSLLGNFVILFIVLYMLFFKPRPVDPSVEMLKKQLVARIDSLQKDISVSNNQVITLQTQIIAYNAQDSFLMAQISKNNAYAKKIQADYEKAKRFDTAGVDVLRRYFTDRFGQ